MRFHNTTYFQFTNSLRGRKVIILFSRPRARFFTMITARRSLIFERCWKLDIISGRAVTPNISESLVHSQKPGIQKSYPESRPEIQFRRNSPKSRNPYSLRVKQTLCACAKIYANAPNFKRMRRTLCADALLRAHAPYSERIAHALRVWRMR